ncbi:MAG: TonB-dependent receptor [Candidatus Hydrogenedentes bacterium]|nr:TonB-dependent receptor [Candidatus Hydrogenedentota bacterium]
MCNVHFPAIALGLALLFAPGFAEAGNITGKVTFEGPAPEMKPIALSADASCVAMHTDKPLLSEVLVLGEGQSMANVLVSVTAGLPEKDYPLPSEPVVLTQEGCRYAPHVIGIRVGQTLRVLNPDGLLHNVHSAPKSNTPLNKAMPKDLLELETVFDKQEEPFPFKCDIHPWMQAWCAVFDHPYFSVTGADGTFAITGLDPGDYEITAWHERLGKRTATVTVAEATDANAGFVFSKTPPASPK